MIYMILVFNALKRQINRLIKRIHPNIVESKAHKQKQLKKLSFVGGYSGVYFMFV
jgi:hypothetical protein